MADFVAPRTQKWDILKFLMIFFVVLGHAAAYYTKHSEVMRSLIIFIYSFHMPVFIFVSGLFSKKSVNEKRKEKIFGYLIMYLLIKILLFCTKKLLGLQSAFSLLSEGGLPWFMFTMAAFMLITMLIKDYSPKYIMAVSIILACVAGYDSNIGIFLSASRIIVFYPFFYLGYCLDREKLEKFCSGKIIKIISALIIVAAIAVIFLIGDKMYWLRPLLTGSNPFTALGKYSDSGFIIRFLYYVIVTIIGGAVIVIVPGRTPLGIAAKSGQRTLAVYAFHYIVFYILYYKNDGVGIFNKLFPMLGEWVIIPLSLLLTLLFSLKPFNDILLKIMNVPMKNLKK